MKNLFFVLGMILLMTSCGHDAPLIQSMPEPDILTRALVTTSNGSTSNPNLIDDWENQKVIILNTASVMDG